MAYIGNNFSGQDALSNFESLSTSISSNYYLDLGGGETTLSSTPSDAFGVSLSTVTSDANDYQYYRLNFGSIS